MEISALAKRSPDTSLLPWRESYLCAVDAATGSNSGPGLYKATHAQSTMQAALLASPTKLYVSHGRRHPHVYNRSDGSHLGAFGETGDGGVYALLTADSHYLEGRGQNHDSGGEVREHNADSRDHIATFRGGNGMVVSGNTAYVLKNDSLSAIDRTTPGQLWSVSFNYPYSLILAGNVLFAGGDGELAAVSTANGATLWTGTVMGKAYGLAVANGRLFVSTDRGTIYCFSTRADLTSTGDWWKLFR
ncbi:MAG: hypothetical protein AMJ84_12570 [Acidithiobacillales bacterium SM23_46]|nr:MAG: hypothetical protein AMJ84_12570 [Acidithiobacillales bacterium SM23_46]